MVFWPRSELAHRFLLQLAGDEDGTGYLRFSLVSTDCTMSAAAWMAATCCLGARSVGNLEVLPLKFATRASKTGGCLPSTCAVIVQYSCCLKAWISRSRSTIKRQGHRLDAAGRDAALHPVPEQGLT